MTSRIAKYPVAIPTGVDVKLAGQALTVKGKLGELHQDIHPAVKIAFENNELSFTANEGMDNSKALSGTMRSLANNMVIGVSEGFVKKLILKGVGYRAKIQGKLLHLTVGFSHPVDMDMPEGVTAECPTVTEIILKGADKQKVTQFAANIRSVRPPEPYKGKGIRYENERIVLKEGKKK